MWAMFLSSYSPLFVLVGIRSAGESGVLTVAAGVLVIAGGVGTFSLLHTTASKPKENYRLLEVDRRDGDVAAYAATYLLPFLTVFSGKAVDVLSLGVFVAFLGFIYVRSRLIYVNPVLMMLGYHLWRVIPVTDGAIVEANSARWPKYLLADNDQIHTGQRIRARTVTSDLLLFDSEIAP